ncbi:MAG: hypothetical protein APF80_12320 [Alphaproteobacteria bacterium BRH_c36]|nr:MAG: hypothetical protein APF80_12320 [Alphaproteobacteria bacterium BRH_c36]
MNTRPTPTLDEAIEAAKKLPAAEQTVIAQEILAMAKEGVLPPARSTEDQAIIAERMSRPRTYVPAEQITALLQRYNPAV